MFGSLGKMIFERRLHADIDCIRRGEKCRPLAKYLYGRSGALVSIRSIVVGTAVGDCARGGQGGVTIAQ